MKRNLNQRNIQQRRHRIMQILQEQGEVSVDQLVQLFDTSEVTIRKDLTALEANGFLLRRYGGAILMPQDIIEDEQEELSERKIVIAKAAAERIRDHNRIIVDSGSTTAALIKQLNGKQGLIVMTNSLSVATELRSLENEPTLLMTGGTWDTRSESFQGKVAEQVLRSYDFDQLFIGADGVDLAACGSTQEGDAIPAIFARLSNTKVATRRAHRTQRIPARFGYGNGREHEKQGKCALYPDGTDRGTILFDDVFPTRIEWRAFLPELLRISSPGGVSFLGI